MKTKKSNRKSAIATSKAKPPEIYVKLEREYKASWYRGPIYALAHIRVKGGEYQYLEWRDGARPRSLYLGRKRAKKR